MASKPTAVQATPATEQAFIPAVQSAGKDSDPRWPLPINEPILLFASVSSWQMVAGDYYPRVHQSRMTPGINMVDSHGNVGGLIGINSTWGRILIPVDIEVEAFGQKVSGYNRQLECRVTSAHGGKEYHYCSIWRKPRKLGATIKWDRDEAGYLKFLTYVKEHILGAEIDPTIIESILEPVYRELDGLYGRSAYDVRAAAKIKEIRRLYKIPEE